MNVFVKIFLGIVLILVVLAGGMALIDQEISGKFEAEHDAFVFQSSKKKYEPTHFLEKSAFEQVGVVTEYDRSNGYYAGGNPPDYTGVCSDVITRALLQNEYDIQKKLFTDIQKFPQKYSDTPDKNINHRRVKNLRVFFERHFLSLPTATSPENLSTWQAGDIVTYAQIPGRLWHVAIVTGLKNSKGIPYIIDNHGYGTSVRIALTEWDAEISGHFRVPQL